MLKSFTLSRPGRESDSEAEKLRQVKAVLEEPDASAEEYARAIKELRKLSTSMDLISRLRATTKEINALRTLIDECSQEKTCLIW
ncbi:hypothetical protein ACFX2I_001382 [Malus domestica]